MTKQWNTLQVTGSYKKTLDDMVEWFKRNFENLPNQGKLNVEAARHPVRFIMHEPYSTYCLKKYSSSEYDLDGDERGGQYYAVMVDGDTPVPVSLFQWDPYGNTKQMIEFRGDDIQGSIKLILGDHETDPISLATKDLTEEYLVEKLEALPNIGAGNVIVSIWPGHWLIEFVGRLSGKVPEKLEIDLPEEALFDCWSYYTYWRDSRIDDEVMFPYPLIGEFDSDDSTVNDAVAAGSIGFATMVPGVGLVVFPAQCRDYNGDGTPNL
ncbi:hypothetical protein [Gimesia chilikensis]|uniref:hypothetical protein n=1 Tax=Gimesia chilikensis TaxID=2605989 RepID=UPI003A8E1309